VPPAANAASRVQCANSFIQSFTGSHHFVLDRQSAAGARIWALADQTVE